MSAPDPRSADPGPVEPQFVELMNGLAAGLDDLFNGENCPEDEKKVGFFLTCFNMGEAGRFNYISNCNKLDVRAMLKEIVARIEARMGAEGRA